MKPANHKIHELRAKLKRLAEQGINGEKHAAEIKLKRLEARFDFSQPDTRAEDLFAGTFKPAAYAVPIARADDLHCANALKWAIEGRTGIKCCFQNGQLSAEAAPPTARNLEKISATVETSFKKLWQTFEKAGAFPGDKNLFYMGLLDGMMETPRIGMLPTRIMPRIKSKRMKVSAPVVAVHPYSVATELGKQIRFSVPLEKVEGQLENIIRGVIENNR